MPFDKKELGAVKRAQAHCHACGEHLKELEDIGLPDEDMRAMQQAYLKYLEAADAIIERQINPRLPGSQPNG